LANVVATLAPPGTPVSTDALAISALLGITGTVITAVHSAKTHGATAQSLVSALANSVPAGSVVSTPATPAA
jgi:hypothetical protein